MNGILKPQKTEDYSKLITSYIIPEMLQYAGQHKKEISEHFLLCLVELIRIVSLDWKKLSLIIIKPENLIELLNDAYPRFRRSKLFNLCYIKFAKLIIDIDESLLATNNQILDNIWNVVIRSRKRARLLFSACLQLFEKIALSKGELLLKVGSRVVKKIHEHKLQKEKAFEFFMKAYKEKKTTGNNLDLERAESNSSFAGKKSIEEKKAKDIMHENSRSPPYQEKQYEEILSPTSDKNKSNEILQRIQRSASFELETNQDPQEGLIMGMDHGSDDEDVEEIFDTEIEKDEQMKRKKGNKDQINKKKAGKKKEEDESEMLGKRSDPSS